MIEMIKKGIFILCMISLIMVPMSVEAKNVTRYATKTLELKQKCNDKSKTLYKVKTNTKLTVVKEYTNWDRIKYNNRIVYTRKAYLHSQQSPNKYGKKYFKHRGVIRWGGVKWTWYTSKQFPRLKVAGRHVDKNGFICDKDDYIILASSIGYKKQRKILPTPFGKFGKVYDTNGTWNYNWRDVYTNW